MSFELDERMRDVLGDKRYFSQFKKLFVFEMKQAGCSQSKATEKLNAVLRCYGVKEVHESTVKRLWND